MAETRAALLISPVEKDHEWLRGLFLAQGWDLISARSMQQAAVQEVPVIVTERDLPDGIWTDVLRAANALPSPPFLIVTSIHADERLWSEALNLGAYDVLAKPFAKAEVIRVLQSAWTRWGQPHRKLTKGTAA